MVVSLIFKSSREIDRQTPRSFNTNLVKWAFGHLLRSNLQGLQVRMGHRQDLEYVKMCQKAITISVPVLAGCLALALLVLFPVIYTAVSVCYSNDTEQTTYDGQTQMDVSGAGPFGPSDDDIQWVKAHLEIHDIGRLPRKAEEGHHLRKGINPRTREQQLRDFRRFRGVSHYDETHMNYTALPCPAELLVEEHHSNYGEPWAGGRDVFEFLAKAVNLKPESKVLEVGCGTLRVGLHFVRYLDPEHFYCLERDALSLMAAFTYELPSQGLLHKRPHIVRDENMEFNKLGFDGTYDLVYASAVFIHVPDDLVWLGLERLAKKLSPLHGRLFMSHNIKFCTRLRIGECSSRLAEIGLAYVKRHTHDSLLFNHYEIWFEFRPT